MGFEVKATRRGFRLLQGGVVLSEVVSLPGATHSLFDVLAALVHVLRPGEPVGILGFAAGGLLAPLRLLGPSTPVRAVDLDRAGFDLFRRACSSWAGDFVWERADAVDWLSRQYFEFPVLLDDLSTLEQGEVVKPDISMTVLPALMRRKLDRHGVAISNLLKPGSTSWQAVLAPFQAVFREVRVVLLDEFENRIVVAGGRLPAARELGLLVREALRSLGSRQAGRLKIRNLK